MRLQNFSSNVQHDTNKYVLLLYQLAFFNYFVHQELESVQRLLDIFAKQKISQNYLQGLCTFVLQAPPVVSYLHPVACIL
mgnify:CR=1 FL=1